MRNQCCTFNTEDVSVRLKIIPDKTKVDLTLEQTDDGKYYTEMTFKVAISDDRITLNGNDYRASDPGLVTKISNVIEKLIKARMKEEDWQNHSVLSLSPEEWERRTR